MVDLYVYELGPIGLDNALSVILTLSKPGAVFYLLNFVGRKLEYYD